MYHVSAQGVDERMINLYYYYGWLDVKQLFPCFPSRGGPGGEWRWRLRLYCIQIEVNLFTFLRQSVFICVERFSIVWDISLTLIMSYILFVLCEAECIVMIVCEDKSSCERTCVAVLYTRRPALSRRKAWVSSQLPSRQGGTYWFSVWHSPTHTAHIQWLLPRQW